MIAPQLARLRARIDAWLRATSLGRRLTLLSLLSVAGLTMLLALNLLSSGLKDAYFDSIEVLNVQQRQLQHFNTETARLQAAIQQYLAVPDEAPVPGGSPVPTADSGARQGRGGSDVGAARGGEHRGSRSPSQRSSTDPVAAASSEPARIPTFAWLRR